VINWRTRSGARSRFLPFGAPENTIPLVDLIVFNIGVGFVFLGGLAVWFAWAGVEAVGGAVDPRGELRALSSSEAPGGGTWISTHVLPDARLAPGTPRFCLVHHEYKQGKSGWKRDMTLPSAARVHVAYGKGGPLLLDGKAVVMDPDIPVAADEATWRALLPDLPRGGRLLEQCVPADGAVFLEGCVQQHANLLEPCPGRQLRMTPGDGTPQPRIDAHAAWLAGRMSMIALALIIPLAYLWRLVRARPLAEALLRWAGKEQPSKRTFWVLVGAVALPLAVWLALAIGRWTDLAPMDRYGYAWGALAVSTSLAFAHLVHERRKRLTIAGATLCSVATVGLRDARGDVVELAVRVRGDAPTVPGPLTGKARAHFGLKIERIHKSGKNHATAIDLDFAQPQLVPVEDASGEGFLDLSTADLDLRAVQRVARGRAARSPKLAEALRDLPDRHAYTAFLIEERFLEPGEQLFVLGAVQRIEPAQRQGNYRDAGAAPVVGARPGAGMIVHAGTERSLVRSLMLERRVVDAMLALVLVTAVAVVAANVIMAVH
jgi:hypothetical protein